MVHVFAFTTLLFVCLGYVLAFGGKPERMAILALVSAFLLSISVISFRWTEFESSWSYLAIIDAALAVLLTIIAAHANRYWPIVLAGMQFATVFAHLAKALSFPLPASGYAIFLQFWGWPMVILTWVGTFKHQARVRKFGAERDWKPLWPHSVHNESSV